MSSRTYLVLGGRHETQTILHVLHAFGIRVIAQHDETAPPDQSGSVPLKSSTIAQYAQLAHCPKPRIVSGVPQVERTRAKELLRTRNVGLIVASHHVTDDEDQFLDACKYAREQLGFTGQPIHLASLCDLFQYPGTRYLLAGIASSGNMVFQRILTALLQQRAAPTPLSMNTVAQLLASFALYHARSLQRLFARHMSCDMDAVLLSATNTQFGQCLIQTDERYSALFGLPLKSYAWAGESTGTHEQVNTEMLSFYARQGYELIYILRHPLDIIVSLAAKMSSVTPGKQRPELALNHEQWFDDAVTTLVRYYEGFLQHQRELKTVHYEQLFSNPLAEIEKLAGLIGMTVSQDQAAAIWQSVDGRPVSGDRHFFAPGAGKWQRYLTAKHRDVVMSSSLPQLAHAFGYEITAGDFSDAPDAPETDEASVDPRFSWLDAILEIPIGKPSSFTDYIERIDNDALAVRGSFDLAHRANGLALMQSPDLSLIVRAAEWPREDRTSGPLSALLRLFTPQRPSPEASTVVRR